MASAPALTTCLTGGRPGCARTQHRLAVPPHAADRPDRGRHPDSASCSPASRPAGNLRPATCFAGLHGLQRGLRMVPSHGHPHRVEPRSGGQPRGQLGEPGQPRYKQPASHPDPRDTGSRRDDRAGAEAQVNLWTNRPGFGVAARRLAGHVQSDRRRGQHEPALRSTGHGHKVLRGVFRSFGRRILVTLKTA